MNKDLNPESDKLKLKITYSSAPCEIREQNNDQEKDRQIKDKKLNNRCSISEFLEPMKGL